MTTTFPAWVLRRTGDDGGRERDRGSSDPGAVLEQWELSDLDDLPVTLRVEASSINYKDALVLAGRPGVVRRFPLVAGIDVTGVVIASEDDRWVPGDRVTLDGAGLGERLHGGLAGMARVAADDLVRVPPAFTAAHAAAIGTAGLTAAMAVLALERHGLDTEHGPVLVTGASGGAGSLAIALLAGAGYETVAATGRVDTQRERLLALGATDVIDRAELSATTVPLAGQRWAAVIDGVGGGVLAGALASVRVGGAVAAYGMAGGARLETTVMPFILRGIALLGIDSPQVDLETRREAWGRLERDLTPGVLDAITLSVPFESARDVAEDMLAGHGTGRVVVEP